jgi:cystathionine beta-lyase/cystathionine gamma-synthase
MKAPSKSGGCRMSGPGYVRLSIGIEHIDDILAAIDEVLKAAR